jgi:type I restriction enzyme S subunit
MHANVSQNWSYATIGEILTFQRGFDITKKQQKFGPFPVVSSSGKQSYHSDFKK